MFFDRKLGWKSDFRLVILNREDWAKVAEVPYPAPHVWTRERMVVMPDSLAAYPGFSSWGFDDRKLNEALTVHEIGHALVHSHGIGWTMMDHSVDELLANVMMASYLLEAMPDMARLLDGAPDGFDPPGSASLSDLDYFYAELGLERYAWFQFELARAAGVMARAKDISVLMPELVTALAGAGDDLPEHLAQRLEGVVPGVAGTFKSFSPESALPEVPLGTCAFEYAPERFTGWSFIAIENRSAVPLLYRVKREEKDMTDFFTEAGQTAETHPENFHFEPSVVLPGKKVRIRNAAGLDVTIEGKGCVRIPDAPGRYVVR